ncbi:MAG: hypothetical protein R2734_02485 [Nocardioides sp.]
MGTAAHRRRARSRGTPTGPTRRHPAALGDDSRPRPRHLVRAPSVVLDSARTLSGRARHYTYVSSRSVYAWPIPVGLDESAPVVDGDPESVDSDGLRGGEAGRELAALAGFAGPVLLARAGLILGPYEQIGRLPYWLERIAAGGRVPCPGPPDRPRSTSTGGTSPPGRGRPRPGRCVQHRESARPHHDGRAADAVP